MKKIIISAIILSTILLFGCTKTDNGLGATKTDNPVITENLYQNKENNFTLIVPKGRTFKENVYGSVLMLFSPQEKSDSINENIGIIVKSIISGENLETLYNQNKDMIKKIIPGAKITNEKDLTINDKPAKSIIYSFKEGDYEIKQEQYIILNEKNYYIITYIALEKTFKLYKNDLEKIIGSFKF